MDLNDAVRELRRHTGDSQQAFATRLGLSISAIANYERNRAPTGRSLAQLQRLAKEVRREDLWNIFRNALNDELGLSVDEGVSYPTQFRKSNEAAHWALEYIIGLRARPDTNAGRDAIKVLELLKPYMDQQKSVLKMFDNIPSKTEDTE